MGLEESGEDDDVDVSMRSNLVAGLKQASVRGEALGLCLLDVGLAGEAFRLCLLIEMVVSEQNYEAGKESEE